MTFLKRLLFNPVAALVTVFFLASAVLYWISARNDGLIQGNSFNSLVAGRAHLEPQKLIRYIYELRAAIDDGFDEMGLEKTGSTGKIEAAKQNIAESVSILDQISAAFSEGGEIDLGRSNKVKLEVDSLRGEAANLANEWVSHWQTFNADLKAILAQNRPDADAVEKALVSALRVEPEFNFTSALLVTAISNDTYRITGNSKILLWIASTLGALFIGFLIWLYSRQFKTVQIARNQMSEILNTVPTGLLLLDKNFKLGEQYSSQLETIIGQKNLGKRDFFSLFERMSDVDTLSTARDYIGLLFGDSVDENLIKDVNPLDQVETVLPNESGRPEKRTLGFGFKRVMENGKMSHLLVSVNDISDVVQLRDKVAKLEKQVDQNGGQTLELLTSALSVDRGVLDDRLARYQQLLDEANEKLKSAGRGESAYRVLIDDIFRPLHTLKGETAALNLRVLANAASEAEHELSLLRHKSDLSGNDFLSVTIKLDELYDRLGKLKQLAYKIPRPGKEAPVVPARPKAQGVQISIVEQVCNQLAEKLGKKAVFQSAGYKEIALPGALQKTLTDVLVHLTRNAIAHGIESPAARVNAGKPEAGSIQTQLLAVADGYEVLFKDDGHGLDFEAIRAHAVAQGRIDAEQASKTDPKQFARFIFEPGFSTAGKATEAAGHGVGLDVVMEAIRQAGGKIAVGTQAGQYTQFRMRFPLPE